MIFVVCKNDDCVIMGNNALDSQCGCVLSTAPTSSEVYKAKHNSNVSALSHFKLLL